MMTITAKVTEVTDNDRMTTEDLIYLRIAMAHYLSDKEGLEIMPKTYEAIRQLEHKVRRIYKKEVNA